MNSETASRQKVTFEIAIYAILLIIALAFRLGGLGQTSLSDHEAVYALQALEISKAMPTIVGGQPGYVGFTSALFRLTEASDFMARFWPALFGSLLVLVPYQFRKILGRNPALILAAFLVIDPGMISLSRTAASSIMGITCFFAGLGFFLDRKNIHASLCWGLFLCSGTEIWIGALTFMVAFFAYRNVLFTAVEKQKTEWLKLLVPGAVLMGLVATQFLTFPSGISGLGSSLSEYLLTWEQITQTNLGIFLVEVLLLQLPMVIFGLVATIVGLLRKEKWIGFLAAWWGLALAVVLINPSRNPLLLGWATVPLLCLASILVSRFFSTVKFDNKWIGYGQIIFSVLMIAVTFLYLMNVTNYPELDPLLYRNKLLAVLLPMILLAAITGLFAWGWSSSAAKTGLLVSLCVLGLAVDFSSGWKAAGWTSPSAVTLWQQGNTVTGSRLLQQELNDLGKRSSGYEYALDIEVSGVELPSLDWALKDYEQVSKSNQVNRNTIREVLITSPENLFEANASYRGQAITWSGKADTAIFTAWDWIKWFVYRQAPEQTQEIILWARNDLFVGTTP